MTSAYPFGIIGGSGVYGMPGIEKSREHLIDTPFGKPSAPVTTGILEGQPVAFLARHGIGHHLSPTEVPYLANIYALKTLGVERIVSVTACGSLREDLAPGDIAVPDQLFDNTRGRAHTFFGGGLVAHVNVADPVCQDLSDRLEKAVREVGARTHRGGTFITVEGPRFSTRAESIAYKGWGMSLIGMTACPEAFLAREAEICYAIMAHVTDYDVWRSGEEPVTVERVVQTLARNTQLAQKAIRSMARNWKAERNCSCARALADALITDPTKVPAQTLEKLRLLLKKYRQ